MMMMMMLNMTGCADAKAGQCHRRDSVGQGLWVDASREHSWKLSQGGKVVFGLLLHAGMTEGTRGRRLGQTWGGGGRGR